MLYRCYNCGYETSDRGRFVAESGDGHTSWLIFQCPQCSLVNPHVSEVDYPTAKRMTLQNVVNYPNWQLLETNDGVRISSNGSNGLMVADHPLAGADAGLLDPSLQGTTIAQHSRHLAEQGRARSKAFHADIQGLTDLAAVDEARKVHGVGPYAQRISHDGRTLMAAADPRWRR